MAKVVCQQFLPCHGSDQKDAGDKASGMGPESHAAAGILQGGYPRGQLQEKPIAEHRESGNGEGGRVKAEEKEGDDAGVRIQTGVAPHHAANGA